MSNSKEKKLRLTTEAKVKMPLTIALVVYSIFVTSWTGMIVVIAMLMSFCGDIFMLKQANCFYNRENNDLSIGMFMFMISHILYAHMMNTNINEVIILIMVSFATVYAVVLAFGVKNKIVLAAFYVVILILNVANTFFFNTIALSGGMLFLISDVLIGICDIIGERSFKRHVLVWGTYIPAQLLLLTSFLVK